MRTLFVVALLVILLSVVSAFSLLREFDDESLLPHLNRIPRAATSSAEESGVVGSGQEKVEGSGERVTRDVELKVKSLVNRRFLQSIFRKPPEKNRKRRFENAVKMILLPDLVKKKKDLEKKSKSLSAFVGAEQPKLMKLRAPDMRSKDLDKHNISIPPSMLNNCFVVVPPLNYF